MKFLLLCLPFLVFLSCSEPDNTGRIEALKALESFARSESFRGSENLYNMEMMCMKVSEPDRSHSKMITLGNHLFQADSLSIELIDRLNKLRKIALGKPTKESERKNVPDEIDYSLTTELSADAFLNEDEVDRLIKDIEKYRDLLCEKVATSQLSSGKTREPYYFQTPKILSFTSEKEKHRLIKEELKKSKINIEDVVTIFHIIDVLTKKKSTWKALLSTEQDWIDYSMSLLIIQQHIMEARWRAFATINSRIAHCATFEFTNIEPVVDGPSIGFVGDTIQFEVFLAAYHRLKEQEASIENNGKLLKFENGKALFEVVLPESGELELNGALTNLTKSGKRYPRTWSHTIKVIEPK